MAGSGTPFEGPTACPFVALELDRDRRADRPDYRHRCFAEPTPAPRSIAHQEAYCLSSNFPACPIFQDWAVRAAAEPIGGPPLAAATAIAAEGDAAEPVLGDDLPPPPAEAPEQPTDAEPETAPPDAEPLEQTPLPAGIFAPEEGPEADGEPSAEQLAAFEGSDEGEEQAAASDWPPRSPAAPVGTPAGGEGEEEVPAFLAARSPRPPAPDTPPGQRISRDEIVPSWDIDGRYGAEAPEDGGEDRYGGLLTALAVILILGLGVAGVFFLPGLISGGSSKTPAPSFGVPTAAPSTLASTIPSNPVSLPPTIAPTIAPPTAVPETPGASPVLYVIKRGDSLARIARRKGVTVEAILIANPEIGNPDHIEVGQVIIIPLPAQ